MAAEICRLGQDEHLCMLLHLCEELFSCKLAILVFLLQLSQMACHAYLGEVSSLILLLDSTAGQLLLLYCTRSFIYAAAHLHECLSVGELQISAEICSDNAH